MGAMSTGEAESILRKESERVSRLADAAAHVLEAERQSGSLVKRFEQLSEQVLDKQKELTELEEEVAKRREDQDRQLKDDAKSFQDELDLRKAEREQIRKKLDELDSELADEEATLTAKRKEVRANIAALELEHSKRQQELDKDFDERKKRADAELADAQKNLDNIRNTIRSLQQGLPAV